MNKKKRIKIVLAAVIVLALAGVVIWKYQSMKKGEETVFCTMDAKLCPDGSYVGRVAPDCEFAACPGEE